MSWPHSEPEESVRDVLRALDAWSAFDAAGELAVFSEDDPGFELWEMLVDLYDYPDVSTASAWAVLRAVAERWLALPAVDRRAYELEVLTQDVDRLLAEQGRRREPQPDDSLVEPWHGRWWTIHSYVGTIEATGSPYMAAVGVLAELLREPADPLVRAEASHDSLQTLVVTWRSDPGRRDALSAQIAELLATYHPELVPPFIDIERCPAIVDVFRRAGCTGPLRVLPPSGGPELCFVMPPEQLAGVDPVPLETAVAALAGRRVWILESVGDATVQFG